MISIGNLQINKLCLGDVEVTKAYLGDVEVYNSTTEPVEKYMTMTVLDGASGTTIAPTVKGTLSPNLQYRINNGSWNDFVFGTTADIHVVSGDVVNWKGVNESGISNSSSNYLNFAISGNPVALSGNVMSLIDGIGETLVIPNDYCFSNLFSGSKVKTVSSDFLPATTITMGCYFYMFSHCSSLVQAPELPATTLENRCYFSMLSYCSSLVQAPELPALTLDVYCYANMFSYCSSLVQAPELPATTLSGNCYQSMFSYCSSLVQAPELPALTLDVYCYSSMFKNCTNLVQAPLLPSTTLVNYCYDSMFQGCSELVNSPELHATTLTKGCYMGMFDGCTSLNYVKCLATDITASNALTNWLYNVASSGKFVKPTGVSYKTGGSGIPEGWTIQNI